MFKYAAISSVAATVILASQLTHQPQPTTEYVVTPAAFETAALARCANGPANGGVQSPRARR